MNNKFRKIALRVCKKGLTEFSIRQKIKFRNFDNFEHRQISKKRRQIFNKKFRQMAKRMCKQSFDGIFNLSIKLKWGIS